MKVCISLLTTDLDRLGGLSIRAGIVLQSLARAGIEVYVIQTRTAYECSRNFFATTSQLPLQPIVVDIPLNKGRSYFVQLLSLWRIPIEKWVTENIDLLDLWDPIINLPKRRDYRMIFSHNHFTPYVWEHFSACGVRSLPLFLEIPYLEHMLRRFNRGVDAYITQTRRQRKWLVERFDIPEDRVEAIPPGVDANLIKALGKSRKAQARNHVIVYSGRLHRWKGLFELIDAFTGIAKEHSSWNLWLVGDGPARDRLVKVINKRKLEDRVRIFGKKPQQDAIGIVSKAEIFVSPSYIETFGMSLLEAMALGLAAITSKTGGAEDLILDNTSGLLVPIRDSEALYSAIERLIIDQSARDTMGRNAQELVGSMTIDNMIQRTVNFYKRILIS